MINNQTTELFFDDLRIPASGLVGEEGRGFRYILDGMNAERILIAAECIGDGRWFIDRGTAYAREREVFGRPIGQNQGVAVPPRPRARLARGGRPHALQGRGAVRRRPAVRRGGQHGASMLAADAAWEAAKAAMQTFGGYAFDAEYDVERKFRETRLFQVAPISTNLILSYVAEHVLGLPRTF